MRRTNGGIALLASFALAAAAAPGVLATEASGPASVYEPPSNRVLTPADITFERNKRTGAVALKDRRGGPLAVTSLEVFGPTGASIQRTGADFTSPALWQAQGFGDVCWSSAPEVDPYVLPMPDQAYGAPAGDWEYQNVIVTTAAEPIVYNLPQPGQYVTGQGAAMESVIFCVRAVDTTQVRLRPLADDSTDSASATATPEASSSSSAASESASPSSSTSTASASAESSESSSPTQTPEPSASETSDPSESASATADSTSRPRPLPSVTSTPSKDEVESFVAPLLNVTVKKKPGDDDEDKKIKICHSASYGNAASGRGPYKEEWPALAGVIQGHGKHDGPLWPDTDSNGHWGDIIPPIGTDFPGRNWTSNGQAVYNNGCDVPDDDQGWLTITNSVAVPDGVEVPKGDYSFGWTCSKGHHNSDDEYRDDNTDQSGTVDVAPGETVQVPQSIDEDRTCTISKVDLPKVSDAYEWETTREPSSVQIVAGETRDLTAKNTLTAKYGTLAITNKVEGGAPDVPSEDYYFDWSCSRDHHGGGDDEYRDDDKDQSGTLAVAPGKTEQVDAEIKDGSTCRVSLESRPKAPEGYYWEQASFKPSDVTIDKGFVGTITAINTLTPKVKKGKGSLTIALDPLDNPDGSPTQTTFTFDYRCSYSKRTAQALGHDHRDDVKRGTRKLRPGRRGASTTIDGIPAGQSCTVTERQPMSIPGHSWEIDYSSQPVTIPNGGGAEVTVTNHLTADKGSLTVTLAGEVTATESFTVFYHCYGFGGLAAGSADLTAANDKKTWTVPSESRCVVGEETPTSPDGSVYVTDIEPSAVWIAGSEEETVTVSNLLEPSNEVGTLVLTETLSDGPSDYAPEFDLTYSCTVNGTTSGASAVVPADGSTSVTVVAGSTCEVTDSEASEPEPSGYSFVPFVPPAAVTITSGGTSTLTATNKLVAVGPDPIITNNDIALTSMCKPAPDEGRLRLRGPAGADWVLAMYHSDTAYSGVFAGADVFVDVPWTSSKDTWTLTVTGSDGTSGKKTKAIGDNDPCTTPVPDPTAPPSPDPVDPQPISPSVDPGGSDTPSSAEETEEQAVENRVLDFCDSKDPADLPEGMADAEVAMTVTNGVSTTEIREPWANLYCVAKANRTSADAIKTVPASGSGASGSSDGSDSGDDVLAKTGGTALTATVAGGVILLGLALLVAPARRRRG